ncbi:hypothetical protein ACGGZK_09550 [Agromyces sp. MMS24-K17]|uniref:hypothetical protein n=1 Tax=Agromyces sp. MMS24-K17 TaxID=3372850 RepID=UPI0037548168
MDVIGGGVLMAAAAVLWVAYLLPTWLRRRQYLATERNAVRLQQTLRILAETSETPEPVRLEATAREIATQQRILHEHEETARLEAEAAEQLAIAERIAAEEAARTARELATRALATQPIDVIPTAATDGSPVTDAPGTVSAPAGGDARDVRRRLRRQRGRRSLLLLAALLTLVTGLVGLAFGLSPVVAVAGAVGVVVGFAELARLARVGRRLLPTPAAVVRPEAVPFEPIEFVEPEASAEEAEPGWVPEPLPRALHLSRGTIAAAAMASIEAAEQLRRAEVESELAKRAAELAPEPVRIQPRPAEEPAAEAPAAEAAPASPYARMGIVGDTTPGFDDLDAVFRRRREAV